MAFLCVSQQGEFKNTTGLFGKSPYSMSKTFYNKIERGRGGEVPVISPLRASMFFIAFWPFLCMRSSELKNAVIFFPKKSPWKSHKKKLNREQAGR
jgi:hypothetical protein